MRYPIEVKIKNFRAIREANICLDGITVVAGENGCGKSTISTLLYHTFKVANRYEAYVLDELHSALEACWKNLENVVVLVNSDDKKSALDFIRRQHDANVEALTAQAPVIVEQVKNSIMSLSDMEKIRRVAYLLGTVTAGKNSDAAKQAIAAGLDALSAEILRTIAAHAHAIEARPIALLHSKIRAAFQSEQLPEMFEVYPLISAAESKILPYSSVKEQLFIDTPMAIETSLCTDDANVHRSDLNLLLQKPAKPHAALSNAVTELGKSIIGGQVNVVNNGYQKSFEYKRNDGLVFNLLNCATGLKSFAILQLLYKNGTLQKDTLVIIDEPEAYLHPQWVVEYARLLVCLNKEVGVRFFIASHHPDMIAAIKYIAEKERMGEQVNFYLAQKADNEASTYSFVHLENRDIEPIFASFNIALDKISQYGESDEQ